MIAGQNRVSARSGVRSKRLSMESPVVLGPSMNLSKFRHLMKFKHSIFDTCQSSDTCVEGCGICLLWPRLKLLQQAGSFWTCQTLTNVERSLDSHCHPFLMILPYLSLESGLGGEHP